MEFYCAPLEGVTGSLYRRAHSALFSGVDVYYIPFLTPREGTLFDRHDLREADPEENRGIPTVPQLLTNRADAFLAGAERLADLGYREVNLNLGCPARTVASKGRGAGLLGRPEELERLLDGIFAHTPLPVSIKTRLGATEESEFPALLGLFRRYPLARLIVHARLLPDGYTGPVRRECFRLAVEDAPWPVCYNGDLFTVEDLRAFQAAFPTVQSVMLGRGLVCNPALARMMRGGGALTREELTVFHGRLYANARARLSGDRHVLCWMKELWHYLGCLFPDAQRERKVIRKAQHAAEYEAAVRQLLAVGELRTEPGYRRDKVE